MILHMAGHGVIDGYEHVEEQATTVGRPYLAP